MVLLKLLVIALLISVVYAVLQEPKEGIFNGSSYDKSTSMPGNCACVCGVPNKKLRIVGGKVTQPNEFTWVVALKQRYGQFYCGATLVTRRHLVTAAHCIDGFNLDEIKVYLGVHNRLQLNSIGIIKRNIKKANVFPKFSGSFKYDNDIVVLELDEQIQFSHIVRPACLPTNNDVDYAGKKAIVAGWGRLGARNKSITELMKVEVPVMSTAECRLSGLGPKYITDNMICAGYEKGLKDACQGDSGGPLIIHVGGTTELIGVVSWGRGCARPNYPGVYTRVSNYLSWMSDIFGDECLCPRPAEENANY